MNDLISREKALDGLKYEMKYGAVIDQCGLDTAYDIIENIPSAEPERTAKVIIHKRYIGTNLNIVGTPSILYEHLCGACKKKVIDGDDYCSHCGARLEWNE